MQEYWLLWFAEPGVLTQFGPLAAILIEEQLRASARRGNDAQLLKWGDVAEQLRYPPDAH